MVLLFVDGMTHYDTADIPLKYDGSPSYASLAISTTEQRRAGSKSLRMSTSITAYLQKNLVSSDDTVIFGFAFFQAANFTTTGGWQISNASGVQIKISPQSDGSIVVIRGVTVLGTSAASVIKPNVWNYIEVKIKISDAAGTYDIVVNGVNVLSGSGVDTQAQTAATFSILNIYGNSGGYGYYTDMYIFDSTGATCNDLLGDVRVDTLMPDGAGNYTQWTPSAGANYECVDDPGALDYDTTYVSTDVLNELDSYTFDDLTPLGATIYSVTENWSTKKSDANTFKVTPLTRVAASDYLGTELTIPSSYNILQNTWEVNPDDLAAWAEADVNGAEFGVKLTTT